MVGFQRRHAGLPRGPGREGIDHPRHQPRPQHSRRHRRGSHGRRPHGVRGGQCRGDRPAGNGARQSGQHQHHRRAGPAVGAPPLDHRRRQRSAHREILQHGALPRTHRRRTRHAFLRPRGNAPALRQPDQKLLQHEPGAAVGAGRTLLPPRRQAPRRLPRLRHPLPQRPAEDHHPLPRERRRRPQTQRTQPLQAQPRACCKPP